MTAGSGGDGGGAVAYVLGMGYNSKAAAGFELGEVCAFISSFAAAHKAARFAALCAPRKAALPDCLPLLAGRLGAELLLFGKAELQTQSRFCLTHSPRAQALYGCGSVAEAAALCGAKAFSCRLPSCAEARPSAAPAGTDALRAKAPARLIAPREKFGNFTIALAAVEAEIES